MIYRIILTITKTRAVSKIKYPRDAVVGSIERGFYTVALVVSYILKKHM